MWKNAKPTPEARLFMHTHTVTQFSVRGGSIYQWKIGQSDTWRWTLVREMLIRDRIGVPGISRQPARIYKAREREREMELELQPLLYLPGARMRECVSIRSEYTLVAGCIVPRARLIKRQGVSHVTNVMWRGSRGYSLQLSRIQLPDDLSVDCNEVMEIRNIVTLRDMDVISAS